MPFPSCCFWQAHAPLATRDGHGAARRSNGLWKGAQRRACAPEMACSGGMGCSGGWDACTHDGHCFFCIQMLISEVRPDAS